MKYIEELMILLIVLQYVLDFFVVYLPFDERWQRLHNQKKQEY